MKVSALARRSGISRGYLTEIEAGRSVPSAIVLHDIAATLGATIHALIDPVWSAERTKTLKPNAL